jgi:hypothetical protein
MVNVCLNDSFNKNSVLLYTSLNQKYGIDVIVSNTNSELNNWKDVINRFINPLETKPVVYNFQYSYDEIVQQAVSNNSCVVIQFNNKSTYPNCITINIYNIENIHNSSSTIFNCEVLYENETEITTKKNGYTLNPNLKTRFNITITGPNVWITGPEDLIKNMRSGIREPEIKKDNDFQSFLSIIYYNNNSTLISSLSGNQDNSFFIFKGPVKNIKKTPTTIYSLPHKYKNKILIYPMCNWQNTTNLINDWSKFNSIPNSVEFTSDKKEADYFMVINSTNEQFDPRRTMYFCMEPHMDKTPHFANFYNRMVNDKNLMFCGTHDYHVNNTEWHLSPSAKDLLSSPIPPKKYEGRDPKPDNVLSVIVSNKNYDEGHILRLNFLRELDKRASENNLPFGLHIYGSSDLNFKNYKGSLPPNKKDNGIFPYKYHFNAENNSIKNYITEKFTDAIVGESYMFYWGCPNINDYYDEKCYTRLSLKKEDLEKDIQTISNCMNEKFYEKNLDIIKNMKKRIIIEYNMFSRMKTIIDLSSVQVFVNVGKNIISGKNPNEFVSNIGNVLRKQGFNNTVFIQLASEISEADERSSYQLFGEMLYNFTKSGENIIFIDFRDLENIQNLRNDLSLGYGLSSREITWAKSDICNSLNEFIRYPFYMRSDVAEKMMFQINSNKNLFSLLKEFSIKTN